MTVPTIPNPEQTWTDATAEQLRDQTRQAATSTNARQERQARARREAAERFYRECGSDLDVAARRIGTGLVEIVDPDTGQRLEPLSYGDIRDVHHDTDRDVAIDRERGRVLATHDVIHGASRICRDPDAYPPATVQRARATLQREADEAASRLGVPAGELIAWWLRARAPGTTALTT